METKDTGTSKIYLVIVFKKDLIVWKLYMYVGLQLPSSEFKKDLIVWKPVIIWLCLKLVLVFKKDLIVWKHLSTNMIIIAVHRLKRT